MGRRGKRRGKERVGEKGKEEVRAGEDGRSNGGGKGREGRSEGVS